MWNAVNVAVCFLVLAAYITYESAMDLWSKRALNTAWLELFWLVSYWL